MPDFFNQVVKIGWEGSAPELLHLLLDTEQRLGRERPQDQAKGPVARTLDLDLLLFGGEIWNLPELTVPHPRMFKRVFVLIPILEIWEQGVDQIPGENDPIEFMNSCLKALIWNMDGDHITQK